MSPTPYRTELPPRCPHCGAGCYSVTLSRHTHLEVEDGVVKEVEDDAPGALSATLHCNECDLTLSLPDYLAVRLYAHIENRRYQRR